MPVVSNPICQFLFDRLKNEEQVLLSYYIGSGQLWVNDDKKKGGETHLGAGWSVGIGQPQLATARKTLYSCLFQHQRNGVYLLKYHFANS